ncbi:MAG: hypothetical protein FWC70_01970 [Defluviitaleaceae bacterium]|nr:hypothetical protein [Defluviitaleaceae bacterium]
MSKKKTIALAALAALGVLLILAAGGFLLIRLSSGFSIPWLGIRPNLPYRVWWSWDEMKEGLGDHYLYPTYLPEVAERSERVSMRSDYNVGSRNRESDELFFGYSVRFSGDWQDDVIYIGAEDGERRNSVFDNARLRPDYAERREMLLEEIFYERTWFNEHTVTVGGIDIAFNSLYEVYRPSPFEHADRALNRHTIGYTFTIDTVTYWMSWVQLNVEDKYADDEQREVMLRVAVSIIEQVREIE